MKRLMILAALVGIALYRLVRRWQRAQEEAALLAEVRRIAERCPDTVEPPEPVVELRDAEVPSATETVTTVEPRRAYTKRGTKSPQTFVCEGCGVTFERVVYPSKPARFCSLGCASRTHGEGRRVEKPLRAKPGTKKPESFVCETCGTPFERLTYPSQPTPRFCCKSCASAASAPKARAARLAKRAATAPGHIAIPQNGDTQPAKAATADMVD